MAEVSLGEVNKPITRNIRDLNGFVHAKRLVRNKLLLAGYKRLDALNVCPLSATNIYTKTLYYLYECAANDDN